jgi:hypothetical protein
VALTVVGLQCFFNNQNITFMKMKIILLAFVLCCTNNLFAQDQALKDMQNAASKEVKSLDSNGWKKGGTFILNLNQGHLSNWVGGGEDNTLGINFLLNYGINYKKDKIRWDNYFEVALGMQNATSFKKFRKTDDRFDVTSKYGRQIANKWYASVLFNFNTQMLPGYAYNDSSQTKISNLLTPGKVLLSLGVEYRPSDNFSVFVSPITSRWLLKSDKDFLNQDVLGVPAGKKSYNEIGAYLSARYKKDLAKWATYTSRLDLFSNYKRNPQNVDVLFNNLLVMKYNSWLATSISVDILYDDDILARTQLKEILGIGLTLKL